MTKIFKQFAFFIIATSVGSISPQQKILTLKNAIVEINSVSRSGEKSPKGDFDFVEQASCRVSDKCQIKRGNFGSWEGENDRKKGDIKK